MPGTRCTAGPPGTQLSTPVRTDTLRDPIPEPPVDFHATGPAAAHSSTHLLESLLRLRLLWARILVRVVLHRAPAAGCRTRTHNAGPLVPPLRCLVCRIAPLHDAACVLRASTHGGRAPTTASRSGGVPVGWGHQCPSGSSCVGLQSVPSPAGAAGCKACRGEPLRYAHHFTSQVPTPHGSSEVGKRAANVNRAAMHGGRQTADNRSSKALIQLCQRPGCRSETRAARRPAAQHFRHPRRSRAVL